MVEVVVKSKNGLHARPASFIVNAAVKYEGDVFIIKDGSRFNAKSIMNIMSLGLLQGESIKIEATGNGSEVIEAQLKDIIERIEE